MQTDMVNVNSRLTQNGAEWTAIRSVRVGAVRAGRRR